MCQRRPFALWLKNLGKIVEIKQISYTEKIKCINEWVTVIVNGEKSNSVRPWKTK